MEEMKAHERFAAAAKGQPFDRLPMLEWASWWDLTRKRWAEERPETEKLEMWELHRHFGLDMNLQNWFFPYTERTPLPKYHAGPRASSIDEYLAIRDTLYPEPYLSPEFIERAKKFHEEGNGVVWFTLEGFFWYPRNILGIENHLYSFYDEPELYHLICRDLCDWQRKLVEYCVDKCDFDFMTFAEDLSYNLGPMLSKEHFDEFLAPYYREIVPVLKSAGILTVVDSDGDISAPVDWFHSVGVEGMLPLERQAGVDVSQYIDKHPEMFFLGHYDKMIMHDGVEALQSEFDRLFPSCVNGRVIPSVDHQTPPSVSYDDYCQYMKLLKRFAVEVARARKYI